MIGGVLSLAIVLAAGAGGWFGYEHLVAQDEGESVEAATVDDAGESSAAAAATPPWPADVGIPTRSWTSFRTSFHPQGHVVRQQVDYDATSRQAKTTLFDTEGVVVGGFEVRGRDVWYNELEGEGWQAAPADADFVAGASYDDTRPVSLDDLFPPSSWPYTTLASDAPVVETPGIRRLAFVVDVPAFSRAAPIQAAEWREDVGRGFGFETATLDVDLDAEGNVVRIDPKDTGTGIVALYAELTEPVVFESPLSR